MRLELRVNLNLTYTQYQELRKAIESDILVIHSL